MKNNEVRDSNQRAQSARGSEREQEIRSVRMDDYSDLMQDDRKNARLGIGNFSEDGNRI